MPPKDEDDRRPAAHGSPPLSRRLLLAAGASVAALTGCSTGGPPSPATRPPSSRPSSSGSSSSGSSPGSPGAAGSVTPSPAPGADLTHGTSGRPEVALTFHGAGDVAILRRMLDQFAEAHAAVTVLGIGQWLDAEPAVTRLVLDGGHDLGNHTWSHRTMPRITAAQIGVEIDRAADVLRRRAGSAGRWFRPSGTPRSTPAIRAAAVRAGYGACLGYDVDPLDYTDPGSAAIISAFRGGVRAGSVVSLHLGHPETLAAMPALLAVLHDRGLAAVTATRLMETP